MARIKTSKNLDEELRKIGRKIGRGAAVRVGFLEPATYPDGTKVALVAAVQNFGTARIPPRPFFSNMVDDASPAWGRELATLIQAHGVEKAMPLMGERIKAQLQESIRDTNEPPLAPATIKRKGFEKPLIDTSNMINSADYEVDLS